MISNLRTTLDYLVWQLVLASGKRPSRRTGFPVVRREKDWEVQSRAALRGIDPEWVAEIEAVQPYHWPDEPSAHPLAILDHVNNLNKHRFLPPAAVGLQNLNLLINVEEAPGEVIESQDFTGRPIVAGGELARFRVPSKALLEVILNESPRARLSFDDGVEHEWHPFELVHWVQETIIRFEPAFLRLGPVVAGGALSRRTGGPVRLEPATCGGERVGLYVLSAELRRADLPGLRAMRRVGVAPRSGWLP